MMKDHGIKTAHILVSLSIMRQYNYSNPTILIQSLICSDQRIDNCRFNLKRSTVSNDLKTSAHEIIVY